MKRLSLDCWGNYSEEGRVEKLVDKENNCLVFLDLDARYNRIKFNQQQAEEHQEVA
jgi:hypothetical protein